MRHPKPTHPLASLVALALGATLGLAACGSSPCVGASCQCAAMETCAFAGGCGPNTAACILDCGEASTCTGSCGEGCRAQCARGARCTITAGANAMLKASGTEATFTAGAGSDIACLSGTCHVTCTGPCTVGCPGATCDLRCPGEATPSPIQLNGSCG